MASRDWVTAEDGPHASRPSAAPNVQTHHSLDGSKEYLSLNVEKRACVQLAEMEGGRRQEDSEGAPQRPAAVADLNIFRAAHGLKTVEDDSRREVIVHYIRLL